MTASKAFTTRSNDGITITNISASSTMSTTTTSSSTSTSIANNSVAILSPESTDILCGRGNVYSRHPGNQVFNDKVFKSLHDYTEATSRLAKSFIVNSVANDLKAAGHRFIKPNKATGLWYELGRDAIHEKVGHAIRDLMKHLNNNKSSSVSRTKGGGGSKNSKIVQERNGTGVTTTIPSDTTKQHQVKKQTSKQEKKLSPTSSSTPPPPSTITVPFFQKEDQHHFSLCGAPSAGNIPLQEHSNDTGFSLLLSSLCSLDTFPFPEQECPPQYMGSSGAGAFGFSERKSPFSEELAVPMMTPWPRQPLDNGTRSSIICPLPVGAPNDITDFGEVRIVLGCLGSRNMELTGRIAFC